MSNSSPRVSIGLPVYNGEAFIEETLDSILSQTFTDFELIIADNASSDGTQRICEEYVRHNPRIRYHRHDENLGAAANYNFVFERSSGEFFKWSAHDDLLAPTFLECCVDVLNERDDVVLVFSRCDEIDENGTVNRSYPSRATYSSGAEVDSLDPVQRFNYTVVGRQPFIPVFGLVRREILAQTELIGSYFGADFPLIGELALRGGLYEIPETLFYYRVHNKQSWGGQKTMPDREAWYDPERTKKRTYPTWRLLKEHERSIWRIPMRIEQRIMLHWVMGRWLRKRWRRLFKDLFK